MDDEDTRDGNPGALLVVVLGAVAVLVVAVLVATGWLSAAG
jgi:hypothetical protein